MRFHWWLPSLALAALCAPLGAEDGPKETPSDLSDSDLRCSAWAAFMLGQVDDQNAQLGLTAAMSWFIGRYEAETGVNIENALTAQYIQSLGPDISYLKDECLPRMGDFGQRLEKHGATLSSAEK